MCSVLVQDPGTLGADLTKTGREDRIVFVFSIVHRYEGPRRREDLSERIWINFEKSSAGEQKRVESRDS